MLAVVAKEAESLALMTLRDRSEAVIDESVERHLTA